jgi:hypothetical protein
MHQGNTMERNEPAAPPADDGSGIPADMLADTPPATTEGQANTQQPDPAAQQEEAFARRLGWRPQEEFPGPKDKWVDAKAFVDKTMSKESLLRSQLRRQDDQIQRLEKLIKDQAAPVQELLDSSREAKARGYNFAVQELDQQMERAVADADTARYKELKRQRDELDKMRPVIPERREQRPDPNGVTPDPVAMTWVEQNPWFNTDKRLNRIAMGLEQALMEEKPYLSTAERLQEVRDDIMKRFPEKFTNPNRSAAPAASRPSAQATRPAAKKQKTVADLDEHGKAALAKFKRMNPKMTDQDYLASYKWDD